MWNKIMPGVKRWVSRYLVVVMMMTFVFSNSFACSVFAAPDEGGERAATASDAIRDSRVKLLNKGKDDVQIVVMSDSAGYEAGDTVCLELYIKNNTGKTITEGKLKYSGGKILEDSAYFEDLSALYEEETFQENFEEEVLEAAEAEKEMERPENDSDQDEEEDMDDAPDRLENLVIQPGQSYYVNFYYTIDEEVKGIKGQTLNFSFRGKTEEGKQVSGKESFRYTIGALNLRPVVFVDGNRLFTGEEHEMVLDFDIGELQEVLEEAELEAIDQGEQKETEEAAEDIASPSDGQKASGSNAASKKDSTYKKASDSDGLKATPSNTWAQWGENDSQNLGKKDEQPLISRLNCQVETYGVKLNGFKIKGFTGDDEVNYGTSVTCKFRVNKDTVPGTYFGKVTASYKYKGRDCKSTQGFMIVVAGEGEITLSSEIDGVEVIVSGPAEYFPEAEELDIQAAEADEEQQIQVMEALQKKSEEEGTQIKDYRAFDIKLMADGVETEPSGPLQVVFKNVKLESDKAAMMAMDAEAIEAETDAAAAGDSGENEETIQIYHLDETVAEVNEMDTTVENDEVVTETDHFSVYVLVLQGVGPFTVTVKHYVGPTSEIYTQDPLMQNGSNRKEYVAEYNREKYEKRYQDKTYTLGGDNKIVKIEDITRKSDSYEVVAVQKQKENGEWEACNQDILVDRDQTIRVFYRNPEGDFQSGVTFYDYDFIKKEDGTFEGINSAGNYDNKSSYKLMVGASRIPQTEDFRAWIDDAKTIDANHTRYVGEGNDRKQVIVQKIVTGLSNGNPIFNTKLSEPGLFTDTPKDGKKIYKGYDVGLNFDRVSDTYTLEGASVQGHDTSVGSENETSINFWPLDNVPSASEQKFLTDNDKKEHNWYFGMRYEFEFEVGDYIGPLKYTFQGDDDLWVFLDDQLILDLGGMHATYPSASQCKKTVKNYVDLWPFLNGSNIDCYTYADIATADAVVPITDRVDKTKKKTHKVTILYMERGGMQSSCWMRFTIPGLKPVEPVPTTASNKITVTKKWEDNDNPYRPESIRVQLKKENRNYQNPVTLNKDNGWTYTWDVPAGDGYSIEELGGIEDYTAKYSGCCNRGPHAESHSFSSGGNPEIVITNTLKGTKSLTVEKEWDDKNDQDGNRPGSVTMRLYWRTKKSSWSDDDWRVFGSEESKNTRILNSTSGWKAQFENLPSYISGTEVEYRVFEISNGNKIIYNKGNLTVIKNNKESDLGPYVVTYPEPTSLENNGRRQVVKNSYTPKTTFRKVVKIWNNIPENVSTKAVVGLYKRDNDGKDSLVGEKIIFEKIAGNNSTNNWEHEWTELPVYAAGREINYNIYECDLNGNPIVETDKQQSLADSHVYQIVYNTVTESPAGITNENEKPRTTTITNTLITAKLRLKKVVAGNEADEFIKNYKFLITLKDKQGNVYTTVALKNGETSGSIVIAPPADGTTFTITEAVPMEYSMTGMSRDGVPFSSQITLEPGADATVTITNEVKHSDYFHHTYSVTNQKDANNCFSQVDTYNEAHGNGNAGSAESKNITYITPYIGEERDGFKEKMLDEEVVLYG